MTVSPSFLTNASKYVTVCMRVQCRGLKRGEPDILVTPVSFVPGSLAERAGVRAKLGGDADWQAQYFQRILPWLQKQDNLTLTRLNGFPMFVRLYLQPVSRKAFAQLVVTMY